MVAVGGVIQDTDYNNIRNDINNVLGVPQGTQGNAASNQGYGQPLESNAVAEGATVTADDLNKLYLDIYTCRLHQVGGTGFAVQEVSVGNIIGADASGTDVGSLTLLQQGWNDYISEAANAVSDRNLVDSGYIAADAASSKERTTDWGYGAFETLDHYMTVTFAGQSKTSDSGNTATLTAANHARAFFNTGGEVRWYGSRSGGATHTKNTDWTNMLSTYIGTVKMNRTATTVTGDGTGVTTSNIGFFDLTTTEQTILSVTGSTYAVNTLTLTAKVDDATNPTIVTLRATFTDADDDYGGASFADGKVEPAVDPTVDGTLTSTIQIFRAQDANNVIEIDAPTTSSNATGTTL